MLPFDLLAYTYSHHDQAAVPSKGEVGLHADALYGLGGGRCTDTLRDAIKHGNVAEAVEATC